MSPKPETFSPRDIERALAGDRRTARALVGRLRPVVQACVAWTLARHAPVGRRRDARQEIGDLVQDVFAALFADDGRLLRTWDPERGSGLDGFVRLVARQQVAAVLRTRKRNPWTEDPTEAPDLERSQPVSDTARRVEGADTLRRLLQALRGSLSPQGYLLFEALYVEQADVAEVCRRFDMSRDAVYAWRSRLRKAARAARADLE